MDSHLEIVFTSDGSQTIHDSIRNTTYHSQHGAVTESKHVFIEAGLKHLVSQGFRQLKILEIGFGTGLNAFLSYLAARDYGLTIRYNGIESNPLPQSIIGHLSYPQYLNAAKDESIFHRMHSPSGLNEDQFKLKVLHRELEGLSLPANNTLVYFDVFGPSDQSELWEYDVLGKVVSSMAPGGILVTYCAQGQFKRNLKQLGCEVESLPGPPGKREMVRATLRKH